jgi:class 3 adenylate cyclase/tetratricopeptide (TPR) repeat protein
MRCASCGQDNRDVARFCDGCGTRLTREPPAYEAPRVYVRPPSHLVEKILNTRSSIEGERKQVTVMFADVKGSMDIAEDVDPEELRTLLERFFEILTEGVHRFEGTVNQFLGDGIMALFGAPIAHEDHAHRACYAALYLTDTLGLYARELRRQRGLSFSVRIGLNSGEVVVGAVGDDMHMEYTAVGHAVSLASRMEQLAEPGSVYITNDTAELVEGFFKLEDLGTFGIKGVRDQMRVHRLASVGEHRRRFDVARARGFSRFVGRREEFGVLEQSLEAAEAGRGQVVGIVGEAGVGKSRLCYEFVERVRASGIKVFEAHGLPHGRSLPFLPILQLFRGYFGIDELDGPVAARQKIAGSLLLLDEGFRDDLALVFDFLGVPDPDLPFPQLDPDARMTRLYGVLAHLIRARADRGPSLVLVEDVQWFDEGSQAFLGHLIDAVPDARTLLIVNYRPTYRPEWTAHSSYRQLVLGPLDADAIAELLEDRLGRDPTLLSVPAYVARRTGGNPFFIEEVVHALIESGALVGERGSYRLAGRLDDATVPPTVQAVVAARLDRLGEREKSVLQIASVIGPEIPRAILERLAGLPSYELDAAIRALIDADFLIERTPYPEPEYAFRHPLTEEVAYRSQLGDRRRRVHADVARAIQAAYADRIDERAALLAHHWEQATERLEAARWHRRAADWTAHTDTGTALRHWRAVRDHTGAYPSDPDAEGLALAACLGILNLGPRHGLGEAEAQSLFDEGRTLAMHRDDQRSHARLLLVFGRFRGLSGDVPQAIALSRDAARLAEGVGLRGLRLAAAVNLSSWATQDGDLRRALELADSGMRDRPTNVRVGAEHLGYSPYIWLAMQRGRVLNYMGRCAEAMEALDRAVELAREHSEHEVLCWAHQGHVDLAELRDDPLSAMAHARTALEISQPAGSLLTLWSSWFALGRAHALRKEWGEALVDYEEALEIIRNRRTGLHSEPFILCSVAEAQLGRGEIPLAVEAAEEARQKAVSVGSRPSWIQARIVLAAARRAAGTVDVAHEEAELWSCIEMVEQTGQVSLEPAVRVEIAELSRMRGDHAAHTRELTRARELYEQMGAETRASSVAAMLGEV